MQRTALRHITDQDLAKLARLTPDMLCIANLDGYFHWVSPRFAELVGWSEEEVCGRPFMEFTHPDEREHNEAIFRAVATRSVLEFEAQVRCANGTYRHLQWNVAAAEEDGSLYCCARDVTDRRRRTAELSERNRLLQLAEKLGGVGSWHMTLDPPSLTWSPEVYRIHGLDPESFTPELATAIEAYHVDDRAMISTMVEEAIARQESYEFDARVLRPTGEVRYVTSRGVPDVDPHGRVVGVFGVFRDVTEERQLEDAVRRSERLASLGTMAAGIAHEINNPLGFVLGYMQLLREELREVTAGDDGARSDDLREMVDHSIAGALRIKRIVASMRAVSHMGDVMWGPVDLAVVVDAASEVTAHQIRPKAALRRALDPVPVIQGDQAALTQMVVNLLVNAAQAVPAGDAESNLIEVFLREEDGIVELVVADTGPGIPADDQDRVFDPFYTTKPVGTGTGLGLTQVHSIVEKHRGTLDVRNGDDRGCVVTITLPVAVEPAEVDGASDGMGRDHLEAGGLPAAERMPRVLVVDDERRTIRLLERVLHSHFSVVCAGSGQEALQILESGEDFDLILCDLMMPTVSGIEVHDFVRDHRPELLSNFVILTGGAFTDRFEEWVSEVDVPHIRKPFDIGELRTELLRRAGI